MLTIGLTGGIASGKSIAARTFSALGAPVLEADRVARQVVAPGTPGLEQIRERFGAGFLLPDGTLDRARMRAHVFGDPAALKTLEAITHPAIRARLLEWRDAQAAPYCVLDVPILVESGMAALVDRILVIDSPPGLQLQRLVARDGIPEALALQMLAAQAPREARLDGADDVILNAGSVATLEAAIRRLHPYYLELASSGKKPASGLHLP
jgi:dephospho-CoA kinase